MSAVVPRTVLLFLLAAVLLYVAFAGFLFVLQPRLVYFPTVPGRELTATPADIGLAYDEVRFTAEDGVELHGWYVPGPRPDASVVIFCHGNAGNISHRLEWLSMLHGTGLGALLFDYRGYGQSTGSPDEPGTYRDARAAWDYLVGERGIEPGRIVIFGESLGGAIAAHLASEVAPRALITIAAFSSVPDLAADLYWFLPVRLLARFDYATARFVGAVDAPVLLIHSRDDEIVPFSHAETLFARAKEPKQLLEIRGDHNSGFIVSARQVEAGIRAFLERHPPR
ncbi:MAG TPA: alpha/beta hydrolase [Gammaproteobacteria bacterium]